MAAVRAAGLGHCDGAATATALAAAATTTGTRLLGGDLDLYRDLEDRYEAAGRRVQEPRHAEDPCLGALCQICIMVRVLVVGCHLLHHILLIADKEAFVFTMEMKKTSGDRSKHGLRQEQVKHSLSCFIFITSVQYRDWMYIVVYDIMLL
ncbi:hypothetical protein EJB05_15811 [Eragrostis curvula]|uniref:Uncharacterized protein n=1 Tax=Eragrostis curvula TaxID=38414 RepID=A0A5J9VGG6_9POAL|nr:hypothetical protein EJB05_15811 [Eragrostis curvula]